MPTEIVTAEPPEHPLYALTTFELRDYRCRLESAIASCDPKNPATPARADMQARLADVLAEQDDRARIARA